MLSALILGGLSFWQYREGSLDQLLGTPATPIGEIIYPELNPERVTSILLKSNGKVAEFQRTADGWMADRPWQDRMDPRAALAIISFASTAAVEDLVSRGEVNPSDAGLAVGNVEVRLKDEKGESLAYFRLGRKTPWLNLPAAENSTPVPTTYLLPLERGRKSHIYAATGNILPLFKDGFKFLRDHRPFYFNPLMLEEIRIRTELGELLLGRAAPNAPWRIVKPLDLPTDPAMVKGLLEGLFELQAYSLSDRAAVTLPDGATLQNRQIAITAFGEETETVLKIYPAATLEALETQAIVSNRPGTVFSVPLKAEPELVSLSDLPLTVNDLRDPTLTNINVASVRGIAIESATSSTVLISREPNASWIVTINGEDQLANEQRLFDLLKAVTESKAIGFETDAAPEDLSPWGLDRPIITLTFLAGNNEALSVAFGLDVNGNLFAKRKGSQSIMRIDRAILDKIAVRPHEWRHARLWSITRVDLQKIVRAEAGSPPLELFYDDLSEKWEAASAGEDMTSLLDPVRATFVLSVLENLQVDRWLSPADEAANVALMKPDLVFEITENTVDDFGDATGVVSRKIALAVGSDGKTVYGIKYSDGSLFSIAPDTYLKLSIPLLD